MPKLTSTMSAVHQFLQPLACMVFRKTAFASLLSLYCKFSLRARFGYDFG